MQLEEMEQMPSLSLRESEQNHKIKLSTRVFGGIAVGISFYFLALTAIPIVLYYSHPLENAILRGDIEGIKRAIAHGADVNAITSPSGRTMLTTVCDYGLHNEELLLRTPDLRQRRIREMSEILIDSGADVDARDHFGYTPLFLATNRPYFRHPPSETTVKAHKELVAMLIAKGADINTKCGDGDTPLHNAVRTSSRNFPVVELLIKSGADVNTKNKKGETPLKLAVRAKKEKISELLRQHGATG
ncbi:MAG: ankyrin repeat domain-containing protein [Planctomycetota bacterium]|jgi:ankyrin repeat protein